ncbi:uncharacterized protein LOC122574983 [Bombus pyrosoma]|uniref:uncharacterized protein LOC122574983 n=1 Tax=Bombus pyrosoma TaxID=396416 RepID=UPI001CB97D21|nr:uncharacterized protein LOC122574983 [Bombus pyrosoma]
MAAMPSISFRLVFTLDITSATLTMVIVGTINGWTTISLLYLISGTGGVPLTLTHDEASWMVSFTVLGSMIGSLLAAQLTVRCSPYLLFIVTILTNAHVIYICYRFHTRNNSIDNS